MTDEEMHNLYPLIYAKQMARVFEQHTQRRAMVYSAGGYAGAQQFVATWAGDTGGGPRPLTSMLNLAFSGHSNHSRDMSVTNVDRLLERQTDYRSGHASNRNHAQPRRRLDGQERHHHSHLACLRSHPEGLVG